MSELDKVQKRVNSITRSIASYDAQKPLKLNQQKRYNLLVAELASETMILNRLIQLKKDSE